MKKKIIKTSITLFFLFITLVFFIGLNKNSVYDTTNLVGEKLTHINLNHFSKNLKITEQDLKKNNFNLINFWSSWCGPCRDEHPFLLRLKDENNINLLGVNFKDKKNNALKFLREFGNPYDLIAEDKFGKNSVNLGIYGIPESILINKDLIIIKKFIGPITEEDFKYIVTAINK